MGLISPDQGDPDFKWETNPMIEGSGEGAGFCFVSAGEPSAEPEHCDD